MSFCNVLYKYFRYCTLLTETDRRVTLFQFIEAVPSRVCVEHSGKTPVFFHIFCNFKLIISCSQNQQTRETSVAITKQLHFT